MDTGVKRDIDVVPDAQSLAQRAAEIFIERAGQPESPDGMFTVALSGGNTPRALYELLADPEHRDKVPWDRTQVFFSDERFVPPDSSESNFHAAQESLLSKVDIPERFVHRVATVDVEPGESAALYDEGIRRVFHADPGVAPSFDLILLGLGTDGHTASLFPDTTALGDDTDLVAANAVPKLNTTRITFTYPLINAARTIMFLVAGEDKADAVSRVMAGEDLPAARVRPTNGRLIWLLDDAAAQKLPQDLRAK